MSIDDQGRSNNALDKYCQNLGKTPKKSDPSKASSNTLWKCLQCHLQFIGSGNSKPLHHCNKIPGNEVAVCKSNKYSIDDELILRDLMRVHLEKCKERASGKAPEEKNACMVMVRSDHGAAAGPSRISSTAARPGTIPFYAAKLQKDDADIAVAMAFYANGIPLNVSRNRYWKRMLRKIATVGEGYKPPSYHQLRTTLLEQSKETVDTVLNRITEVIKLCGCSLISDGWSNAQSRPVLNFLVATPRGTKFLFAKDTSGADKDAAYIAEQLALAITQQGAETVVSLCTDSGYVDSEAADLLAVRFPSIAWVRCAAQDVEQALHSIGELPWVKEILDQAANVVEFVTSHHASLAVLSKHTVDGRKRALQKPAAAGAVHRFIVLDSLLELRNDLKGMTEDPSWLALILRLFKKQGNKQAIIDVCTSIASEAFWQGVRLLVDLALPALLFLRLIDARSPTLGKVYHYCNTILGHLTSFEYSKDADQRACRQREVVDIWVKQWGRMYSDMHATGYLLDPEYHGHWDLLLKDESAEGKRTLAELTRGRNSCFMRLLGQEDAKYDVAMLEYGQYIGREGLLADPCCWRLAESMPAWKWWMLHGACLPTLCHIAMRVLGQPAAAGGCERNWSVFDFIHNTSRNKLRPSRASMLAYVFSNLRLLDSLTSAKSKLPDVSWAYCDKEEEEEPEEEDNDDLEEEEEEEVEEEMYVPEEVKEAEGEGEEVEETNSSEELDTEEGTVAGEEEEEEREHGERAGVEEEGQGAEGGKAGGGEAGGERGEEAGPSHSPRSYPPKEWLRLKRKGVQCGSHSRKRVDGAGSGEEGMLREPNPKFSDA